MTDIPAPHYTPNRRPLSSADAVEECVGEVLRSQRTNRQPDARTASRPANDDAHQQHDEDTAQPPAGKGLSRRARVILVAVALIALVAGVVWYVRHETRGKYLQETNDAQVAVDMVVVSPRVAGYVEQVLVPTLSPGCAGRRC